VGGGEGRYGETAGNYSLAGNEGRSPEGRGTSEEEGGRRREGVQGEGKTPGPKEEKARIRGEARGLIDSIQWRYYSLKKRKGRGKEGS